MSGSLPGNVIEDSSEESLVWASLRATLPADHGQHPPSPKASPRQAVADPTFKCE